MKKLFSSLVLLAGLVNVQGQTVSTFFNDASKRVDDAMVLDPQGNLYGSHFMGTNVYKITPAGVGTIFATGFNTPNGLAFDSQNNLYVCDLSGNRIYKLSYSGTFLDTIPVSTPSGIIKSFDSDTMLFTQYTGNKLSKLAPDGTVSLIASGSPMVGSVGLAYNYTGQLYVANFTNREIYSVQSNIFTYVATVPGPPSGALGFIAYANGFLWGTGYNDHKIYKVDPNFIDSVVVFAGTTSGNTDGGIATAKFNSPNGIISSVTGDSLFVSDFGSGRIRIISFQGVPAAIENEPAIHHFKIYPNPSAEFINIEYSGEVDLIEIYDALGKRLITTVEKKIYINHLPQGVYLVVIQEGNRIIKTKMIKN